MAQEAGLRLGAGLEGRRRELLEWGVVSHFGGFYRMVVVEVDGTMIGLHGVVCEGKVIVRGEVRLAFWYAGEHVGRLGTG